LGDDDRIRQGPEPEWGWSTPFQSIVTFTDAPSDYCVRLRATDLRDGTEVVSSDLCAATSSIPTVLDSQLDQDVAFCDAPPSAALEPRWCKSHAEAPECTGAAGASGTAGASGAAGAGSNALDGSVPDDSSGCSCRAAGSPPWGSLWFALAALGFAAGLRRRRRCAR
jgi:MYXO-CTERM domain-containing protein